MFVLLIYRQDIFGWRVDITLFQGYPHPIRANLRIAEFADTAA